MFSFLRGFLWLCIRSLAWLLRHAPFYQDGTVGRKCIRNLFGNLCYAFYSAFSRALPPKKNFVSEIYFCNLYFQTIVHSFSSTYVPTCFGKTNYQTAIFRQLFFSFFPFKSIFCSNWIFTIAIAEIICVVTALWSVECFEGALEDFCPINHRKILLQQKVRHFTFINIAENISKTTFSESFLKWSKVKLSCCI